jgi:hypothetical protein
LVAGAPTVHDDATVFFIAELLLAGLDEPPHPPRLAPATTAPASAAANLLVTKTSRSPWRRIVRGGMSASIASCASSPLRSSAV